MIPVDGGLYARAALSLRRALSPRPAGCRRASRCSPSRSLVLWLLPSNDYIFLPDRAHPVEPLVDGRRRRTTRRRRGGIYFVDVIVRKATLIERLFAGLHDGADLVPAVDRPARASTTTQRQQLDLQEMTRSQQIAAAVALRAARLQGASRRRPARSSTQVDADGAGGGKLQPTDVIVAVDGKRVAHARRPAPRCSARRSRATPCGSTVRRGAGDAGRRVRDDRRRRRRQRAVDRRRPRAGRDDQAADPVTDRRRATSAARRPGLAFALDVIEELGRDVDHGHKIAATGEISLDGSVRPIGGMKQKTIGARKAGVDVFLVPAGENAAEARRYAHGLRIVPVKSFRQALRALATLPLQR